MRLTAELIRDEAESHINPIKQRELSLRSRRIPAIENLGATKDAYECLDLTDNDLLSLSNFPRLGHLTSLLCAKNRISKISPSIGKSLPNLQVLQLSFNVIEDLHVLKPLGDLKKLEFLCLMDCPVQKQPNYRLFVVYTCKALRFLDYTKVKDVDRRDAEALFKDGMHLMELDQPQKAIKRKMREMTEEDRKRLEEAIMNAGDLEEITRLEKVLREGKMPV